jgi:hypothetical protein
MPDVRGRSRTLATLARRVPSGVEIWLGGPATPSSADVPSRITTMPDFDTYLAHLARIAEVPVARVPA